MQRAIILDLGTGELRHDPPLAEGEKVETPFGLFERRADGAADDQQEREAP